jgi:MoaA/NifB/PqqE/SkfB family radical SAM enzyme
MLKVEIDRRLKRVLINGKPYFIKIDTTNQCDAGCEYCSRDNTAYPLGQMGLDNFKKIIDINKDYAFMIALHFTGEPLLNDSIYDMINYAHLNKMATYLSSNFQHFRKEDACRIVSSGLDLLTVSIDGASQETYRRYRQKGELAGIFQNIQAVINAKRELQASWPRVNLQFLVMEHNEHEIAEIKNIAKGLGVDTLEFKPLGLYPVNKYLLPKNPKYVRRAYRRTGIRRKPCWWLWSSLVVLWNTEVVPCCSPYRKIRRESCLGSIIKEDIIKIRNSGVPVKLRRQFLEGVMAGQEGCVECPIPYGNMLGHTV